MPVRVSALRALGGTANVFAIESFMDELAAAAGADPVEFRLRHLKDPRARAVIEAVAAKAGWRKGEKGDGTRGRGIGFARYKNGAIYVAVIAEVEIGNEVAVKRAWAAIDAGLVINPDGLINQTEGGIIQAVSWTLKEEVQYDRSASSPAPGRTIRSSPSRKSRRWRSRSSTGPTMPPLGAGEGAQGPTARRDRQRDLQRAWASGCGTCRLRESGCLPLHQSGAVEQRLTQLLAVGKKKRTGHKARPASGGDVTLDLRCQRVDAIEEGFGVDFEKSSGSCGLSSSAVW